MERARCGKLGTSYTSPKPSQTTGLFVLCMWVIYMNTNIKLFSLVLFKVSPVDEKPIMFDHGDNVTFTTKTLISPSPSGLLELAKRVHTDGNKIDKFNIITTINYVEGNKKVALKDFYSLTPKQKDNTIGIFEIDNEFNIDTKLLPSNINQVGGYIEFQQQWSDAESHQYTGNIITTCLPIFERG